MNYLWTCEATKPLVIFGSILLGAFALNMLLMSFSALMPLTVVIKLVGMVAGLYFAGKFFIDTTKSLYGRIKELKAGKCDNECKKSLIGESRDVTSEVRGWSIKHENRSFSRKYSMTNLCRQM